MSFGPLIAVALILLSSLAHAADSDGEAKEATELKVSTEAKSTTTNKDVKDPKDTTPLVRVSSASMSGGPNEGGESGQVRFSFTVKGNEHYHIGPSEIAVAAVGGFSTHLNLDASLAPIALKSYEKIGPWGASSARFGIRTLEISEDANLLVHDVKNSNVATIFTSPLSVELGFEVGRVQMLITALAGPATGFLCTEKGCAGIPFFTPMVGAELVARYNLNTLTALEAAGGVGYLISTDLKNLGKNNYKAEVHGYVIRKYRGNEFFTGLQYATDDKDIKRVGETSPNEDVNFAVYGVVGVALGTDKAAR